MSFTNRLAKFRAGFPIPAAQLNEIVSAVHQLGGVVVPPGAAVATTSVKPEEEAQTTDDNVDANDNGPTLDDGSGETWSFANRTVGTETLQDVDDASTFIEVEQLQTLTLRRPNGRTVTLIVAAPEVES